MKKISYMIMAAAMMLGLGVTASAQQNLRSGYFLDGYTYKYKMNPSAQGERGFFAIPVLGNLSIGLESNLALSNFVYPGENGPVTFLHPSVSDATFLDGLKDYSEINANINTSILAAGFRIGKSYHTVDLSLRTDIGTALPKDMFRFMKVGASDGNTMYNFSNIAAKADARLELAYGYSRPITWWLTAGARVKLLMGLAKADMCLDEMNLALNADAWTVKASGELALSAPVTIPTKAESADPASYTYSPDALDWSNIGLPSTSELLSIIKNPSNFGAAIDLGLTAYFLDYFTASASILDLGFMKWNNAMTAATPTTSWTFDGFKDLGVEGGESIGNQLSGMGEELLNSFNFQKTSEAAAETSRLAMTLHVGLEARMPFYERLSFGILGTRRFDGNFSWTEGRVAANIAPVNWLSATANYAVSDFGHSVGAALNLHTSFITLFVGTDSLLPFSNVTPQFIPIDSWNTNVTVGLNLALGKYNGRFSD
ncbi:MAG: hypothetical protein IJX11_04240 [Bacteroidales bacterium]|nr:hypothetical protein [Bacteroidales bacterium]